MKRRSFEDDKGWNKEKNLFRIPQGSMILPTKAPEHRTDLQFFFDTVVLINSNKMRNSLSNSVAFCFQSEQKSTNKPSTNPKTESTDQNGDSYQGKIGPFS